LELNVEAVLKLFLGHDSDDSLENTLSNEDSVKTKPLSASDIMQPDRNESLVKVIKPSDLDKIFDDKKKLTEYFTTYIFDIINRLAYVPYVKAYNR
jgi:hypothetical protein